MEAKTSFSTKTVGLLIVSLITFQLICFLGISSGGLDSSKVGMARAQIQLFGESLSRFWNDSGRYPTTEEGLVALRNRPSNVSNWKGPYINKDIPSDPWGKPYVYIYPAKYGNKHYDIYSFGENMKDDLGGKDDITNWQEVHHGFNLVFYYLREHFVIFALIIVVAGLFWRLVIRRKVVARESKEGRS